MSYDTPPLIRKGLTGLCPVCILLAAVLLSCGTTDPESTRNTMTALVDNVTWRAGEVSAVQDGGRLTIDGRNAIGDRLQFTLFPESVGEYALGEGLHTASFSDEFATWWAFGVGSGSLTITTLDGERVSGFFGFRAKDTATGNPPRVIASGKFDIDF